MELVFSAFENADLYDTVEARESEMRRWCFEQFRYWDGWRFVLLDDENNILEYRLTFETVADATLFKLRWFG